MHIFLLFCNNIEQNSTMVAVPLFRTSRLRTSVFSLTCRSIYVPNPSSVLFFDVILDWWWLCYLVYLIVVQLPHQDDFFFRFLFFYFAFFSVTSFDDPHRKTHLTIPFEMPRLTPQVISKYSFSPFMADVFLFGRSSVLGLNSF